jgi:tRNA pseudouridine38-40 synthase
MVAHCDIPRPEFRIELYRLPLAINAHLPDDIRIVQARLAPASFHARFNATGKQYRYFVWNQSAMNPLLRHQAWLQPRKLDLALMRTAARLFIGRHDFASFAASRQYEPDSTVRTVTRCEVKRAGPLLTFTIEGDGFLYKMCRGMVGTLVQIGLGKFPPADVTTMLEKKDRRAAGMSAPAHGLVLWKVFYRGSLKLKGRKAVRARQSIDA